MEFKGTKGKWVVTSINGRNGIKTTNDDFMFIDTWNGIISPELTDEQARANALLISKAPEMLEFLMELYNDKETYSDIGSIYQEKLEQLIKEATEL